MDLNYLSVQPVEEYLAREQPPRFIGFCLLAATEPPVSRFPNPK
jgi:hypothetical protein